MIPRSIALASLLAGVLVPLGTVAACSLAPSSLDAIAWTESGLTWTHHFEIKRERAGQDAQSIARAFPGGEFHASPAGDLLVYRVGTGGRNSAMCDFGPYETRTWTPETGERTGWQPPQEGRIVAVDWAGGRVAVARPNATVSVHDQHNGVQLAIFYPGDASRVVSYSDRPTFVRAGAFSPDGGKAAFVSEYGVFMYNARTWSYLYEAYPGYGGNAADERIAFSQDGSRLAVASSRGDRFSEIRVLDLSDPEEIRFADVRLDVRAVRALAYAPDASNRLAVVYQYPEVYSGASTARPSVAILDAGLNVSHAREWPSGDAHAGLAWSPQGTELAFGVNGILHVAAADLSAMRGLSPDGRAVSDLAMPGVGAPTGDFPRIGDGPGDPPGREVPALGPPGGLIALLVGAGMRFVDRRGRG